MQNICHYFTHFPWNICRQWLYKILFWLTIKTSNHSLMAHVTNDPAEWISMWTLVRKHGDRYGSKDPDLSISNVQYFEDGATPLYLKSALDWILSHGATHCIALACIKCRCTTKYIWYHNIFILSNRWCTYIHGFTDLNWAGQIRVKLVFYKQLYHCC